jgi:hypothetical protein
MQARSDRRGGHEADYLGDIPDRTPELDPWRRGVMYIEHPERRTLDEPTTPGPHESDRTRWSHDRPSGCAFGGSHGRRNRVDRRRSSAVRGCRGVGVEALGARVLGPVRTAAEGRRRRRHSAARRRPVGSRPSGRPRRRCRPDDPRRAPRHRPPGAQRVDRSPPRRRRSRRDPADSCRRMRASDGRRGDPRSARWAKGDGSAHADDVGVRRGAGCRRPSWRAA